jgi:hypothetical protein
VRREKYWEVTDRHVNLDHVPPAQRAKVEEFFGHGLNPWPPAEPHHAETPKDLRADRRGATIQTSRLVTTSA